MRPSVSAAGAGTYALLLRIDVTEEIAIGRRHRLRMAPGWAVYVGSAFGPGGAAARWPITAGRRSARIGTSTI